MNSEFKKKCQNVLILLNINFVFVITTLFLIQQVTAPFWASECHLVNCRVLCPSQINTFKMCLKVYTTPNYYVFICTDTVISVYKQKKSAVTQK